MKERRCEGGGGGLPMPHHTHRHGARAITGQQSWDSSHGTTVAEQLEVEVEGHATEGRTVGKDGREGRVERRDEERRANGMEGRGAEGGVQRAGCRGRGAEGGVQRAGCRGRVEERPHDVLEEEG